MLSRDCKVTSIAAAARAHLRAIAPGESPTLVDRVSGLVEKLFAGRHSDYQNAKVIAVTASAGDHLKKIIHAGFDGMISKPIRRETFAEYIDSIIKGDFSNPTVAPSVRSNLTTILGRTAAYKNTVVTWDEMMRANEKWSADLSNLKA